jgi:hypothetical protein
MSNPPPDPEPTPEEQDLIEVNADFDPDPPTASSLCGFRFPPNFTFGFGLNFPPIPACLLDPLSCIPFPWLSLNCDLAEPISLGWGGGKEVAVDPGEDESNPFVGG